MRYNSITATHLMRLQEQELRRNAERARTHSVEPAQPSGPMTRIGLALVVLAPIVVFVASFAGRNWP